MWFNDRRPRLLVPTPRSFSAVPWQCEPCRAPFYGANIRNNPLSLVHILDHYWNLLISVEEVRMWLEWERELMKESLTVWKVHEQEGYFSVDGILFKETDIIMFTLVIFLPNVKMEMKSTTTSTKVLRKFCSIQAICTCSQSILLHSENKTSHWFICHNPSDASD